jgi:hypothetical protein
MVRPSFHLHLSILLTFTFQGSIFSAIGRGINAIISAIAGVLMTIVGAITNVRPFQLRFAITAYTSIPDNCHDIPSYRRYSMLQMLRFTQGHTAVKLWQKTSRAQILGIESRILVIRTSWLYVHMD